MDLDAISNCSGQSAQSEEIRSNTSTLSGISIYQNEFSELRHLINPTKYPSPTFDRCSTPKQDSGCGLQYEESDYLFNFTNNLPDSQRIQDKYEFDLYNVEKSLELKYYDKIEKLLKANHRLQAQLDNANEQITRLLKNNYGHSKATNSCLHLEKKYHELTQEFSQLQQKYFQTQNQKEEHEVENKQLLIELSELNIDIVTKSECLKELKEKLSQQYVEIETLLKDNLKKSQNLNDATSEITHLKKTQEWYKERLHICQSEKQTLSDDILKCKTESFSQQKKIDSLNVELSKWKAKYDEVKLDALKETEKLQKELRLNSLKNCSTEISKTRLLESNEEAYITNYYENSIQDLTLEIVKIKEYVEEQDNLIEKITKENSELLARCITLQGNLRQEEIVNEELQVVKKMLNVELKAMKDKIKQNTAEIVVKDEEILSLRAELTVKNEEHETINQTIKTLREQFSVFKLKYKELKEELTTKNKQILNIENEKQKLFMENNWNVCELERLNEKDIIITQLKDEIAKNRETINEHLKTIKSLEDEMEKDQEQNFTLLSEKQKMVEEGRLEINKYEQVLVQYKTIVTDCETQIANLQKSLHETNAKVTDYRDNIKILKQEVNKRDKNLNEINNKCMELENEIKRCSENNETSKNETEHNTDTVKNVESYTISILPSVNQTAVTGYHELNSQTIKEEIVCAECSGNKIVSDDKANKTVQPKTGFEKHLLLKLTTLQDRIKTLDERTNKCFMTLNNISAYVQSDEDKVQKLNILLQVKDLELKEKQKKYETNVRTLLRKVKEHMKGRNSAEKQNKYLQEMYNSLSDENNSLKLEIKLRERDVEDIRTILEKYTIINEKLKSSVVKLEEQINKNSTCDECVTSNEKIEFLEKSMKELENGKLALQSMLDERDQVVVNLRNEVQQFVQENSKTCKENKKLSEEIQLIKHDKELLTTTINSLETEMKHKESIIDQLNQEIRKLSATANENNRLRNILEETDTHLEYLNNEIKILNSRLQMKSEELRDLEDKNSKIENRWLEKEKHSQNVINTLKRYVQEMQSEYNTINSEKNFLQRLCNDLKIALTSHVNHNKMLKQQLNTVSKENDFNSLPNLLPNIPCDNKYDEDYINQLLQQNKSPLKAKPVTEMKSCLDTLKREVLTLQEQIARKNIHY